MTDYEEVVRLRVKLAALTAEVKERDEEIAVLHNTCGHYEQRLAAATVAANGLRAEHISQKDAMRRELAALTAALEGLEQRIRRWIESEDGEDIEAITMCQEVADRLSALRTS